MPVSANWLLSQLESKYPPMPIENPPRADVAIVLGGSISQPLPPRVAPDQSDAVDRVLHAARVFRAGKVGRILVSGGNLPWETAIEPESRLVRDLLVELGVPANAIFEDAESRNTHENAINSAAIMRAQHWRELVPVF
jgi:uncharacterized SAM-binding protein YcdF (DUF218 family)